MEAYEQFVALAIESEGFVVGGPFKFPVTARTSKSSHVEVQTHGREIDLIGGRRDRLVLASVKSYFGSHGVSASHLRGEGRPEYAKRYAVLNNPEVRSGIVKAAAKRFGYGIREVELRLYVGKFARGHRADIEDWCASQRVGAGAIRVFGPTEVVEAVRRRAVSTEYQDNAVLAALKVLAEAGHLTTSAS